MTSPAPDLTLAGFAARVPAMAGGNTPWASRYARELRDVIVRQAHRSPRSVQRTLGPSEIGHACDRQVVSKLSGQQPTNHVSDPWPSIVGLGVHALFAQYFRNENTIDGRIRWVPEVRVHPDPAHPGTADLYDADERALVDHKVLGPTSMAKVQSADGPPRHYVVQMLLYAQGYRNLGLRVDRVVLAAWPRTSPTLDAMYCWERPYEAARDDEIVRQALALTAVRKQVAELVLSGQVTIDQVRRTPSSDCYFCFVYRPQSALDGGPGCPGHSLPG